MALKSPKHGEGTEGGAPEEKLPLDAKLLSEAVIEFNISRRSVGLYPPGHAIITGSIQRAFGLLTKLFQIRNTITLGIAKDSLVIDDLVLDKKNPVYREVAESFHNKGLAGISFHAGLTKEELTGLQELLTAEDMPTGKAFVEIAEKKGLAHLKLSPIDYSGFRFVEDGVRDSALSESAIWEDYVYGLLHGKLTDSDTAALQRIPPGQVAEVMNREIQGDDGDESYDRVITSYLQSKSTPKRLSRESLEKLVSLTDNLKPEIKKQFLSRTFSHVSGDLSEVENLLGEMTSEGFQRMVEFFTQHSSMIPDTLKNIMDKLSTVKADKPFSFDLLTRDGQVVHDIEIGDDLAALFREDHFKEFVSEDYKNELNSMLKRPTSVLEAEIEELRTECKDDVIDRVASEVMIEAMDADILTAADCLNIFTRLTELSTEFVDTGRFEEVLNIYNTVYSHSLSGRFRHEASGTLRYFFQSEAFLGRVVEAVLIWGKKNRHGAVRLTRGLRTHLASPLLDALAEESSASSRKLLLSFLIGFGSVIVPECLRRLGDSRWYVKRNMLYLLRACGSAENAGDIRKHIKHKDPRVGMEALKALLRFDTQDSVPHLKLFLQSGDDDLRERAVALSGAFRVREVVPILLGLLEKKDPLGAHFHTKIPVVKALGLIGDRRAVGPLLDIIRSKTLFRRGYLESLKVEIFRNLTNYPPDSLQPLAEEGMKSENEEIRSISVQLMAKDYGKGGTGDAR